MKVFYHKGKTANIGDDLNEWIWHKSIPNLSSRRANDWLIGIGTILDDRLDTLEGELVICGSGYRPSDRAPFDVSRQNVSTLFVRGPLTAQHIGVDPHKAITDPAILIADFFTKQDQAKSIGFIPHVYSLGLANCKKLADRSGLTFIDPSWDTEKFMRTLSSCSHVITEAMHGAILADSIGIPWQRIKLTSWRRESETVSDFKWSDWASSMELKANWSPSQGFINRRGRRLKLINPLIDLLNTPRFMKKLNERLADRNAFSLSESHLRQEKTLRIKELLQTIDAPRP